METSTIGIQTVRDQLADKALVFYAIVTPFALVVSIARVFEHGWLPLYYLHIGITALVIVTAVFRKRLSYGVRVSVLLGLIFLLGVASLVTFGLLTGGIVVLFSFAVMTATAFGTRAGLIACAVDLGLIIITSIAVCTGTLTFNFDISEYATSITGCAMMTASFFLFAPATIIAFGVIYEHMEASHRQLWESEKKYRELVENANVAIFRTGIDGEILQINPQMAFMFGYGSPEELISSIRNAGDLYADPRRRAEIIRQGSGLLGKNRFEVEFKKKDGTLFIGLLASRTIPDRDGRTAFFEGFIDDISERKRAEGVLRESESRYKMIFEQAPIAINLTRGADILYANPAFLDMFRFSDFEEVMKLQPLEMFAPEWQPRILENIKRRADGLPVPNRYEAECLRKDGSKLPVLLHVSGTMFSGGPVAITFIVDITERKQAEENLMASERKYRTLFNSANDGILLMEKEIFVDCNAKTLEMFGVTRDQIIGRTPYRFSPETQPDGKDSKQSTIEKVEAVLKGEPLFFEWQHCRYDGARFDAEVSLTDMEVGEKQYILAIVRDVTQRKRDQEERMEVQKQLQQAQRMESIGTLAGGIAHDFNNILSSILGFSELVKYDLPDDGHESMENIESVIKAGLRAKDLVQHILTFSRSSESVKSSVMPSRLVKEVVKLLKASLPAAIEIRTQINDAGLAVFGDATQIHQVIMNLCVNAAHAMKGECGLIGIRVEKITLATEDMSGYEEIESGDYIKLTVSDTGHGMPEAIIERIFDPFFTTKPRGEGTGMGLSVVHGIVKEMKGAIQVESEPGKGTTFHVLLPAYTGAAESETFHHLQAPQKGKGRILFVDDDKDIVTMAGRTLKRLGYYVTPMTGSVDALDMFTSDPGAFDLVITDLDMPKMNGIELSRKILKKRYDIPIILCTGSAENVTPRMLDEMGIHKLVLKPIIVNELADIVKNALERDK